jgi:hypothetical protein
MYAIGETDQLPRLECFPDVLICPEAARQKSLNA